MKHQQNTQRVIPPSSPGEVITLPPVKVRTRKPALSRKTRAVAERHQQQRLSNAAQHAGFGNDIIC